MSNSKVGAVFPASAGKQGPRRIQEGLAALGRTEYVPETQANPTKVRRAVCHGGMGGKPGLLLSPKDITLDQLCLTILLFNAACLQSRINCGNIIKRKKSM